MKMKTARRGDGKMEAMWIGRLGGGEKRRTEAEEMDLMETRKRKYNPACYMRVLSRPIRALCRQHGTVVFASTDPREFQLPQPRCWPTQFVCVLRTYVVRLKPGARICCVCTLQRIVTATAFDAGDAAAALYLCRASGGLCRRRIVRVGLLMQCRYEQQKVFSNSKGTAENQARTRDLPPAATWAVGSSRGRGSSSKV